ncbi:hypothetical protein vseg_021701 [Gypsophila vaccaria]
MTYFILFILFSIVTSLGEIHGRTLSRQPSFAHTIHHGPTYDCVDFYEQPAFSHPSLKHLIPKERRNSTTSKKVKFNEIDGCPSGTVPIRSSVGDPRILRVPAQVHCYAVVRTKLDIKVDRQFFGTNALQSLNKPKVSGWQWSLSRFKLWVGSESVMAGWMVFPDYYMDNDAHLFVSYTNDAHQCTNTDCPGFVQKSSHIPLGIIPNRYSTIGGAQYSWNITIEMDKKNGDWHLYMTSDKLVREEIGYWPGNLFEVLKNAAAQVEWGGEINDPAAVSPAPEMGSGERAGENEKYAGFFKDILVLDSNPMYVPPENTEEFSDCPDLYFIRDAGEEGDDEGDEEEDTRTIYFGGRQT